MQKLSLKNLVTSLTTFVFLVIGVSGVMMYFHLYDEYVKELHEIIGLFFVAVVLLHVFYNFKSMKNYFSKKEFRYSAITIAIVSLVFMLNTQEGNNPKKAIIMSVINTSLENSTKVFEKDIVDVKKRLALKGISVSSNDSIKSIADKNKISPFDIIKIIQE